MTRTRAQLIGHRGAAGLALENSRESIIAALSFAIDAIEFDVRKTKDDRLVVMHDRHTGRVADRKVAVNHLTLAELQAMELHNGQTIPTLEDILALIGDRKPVVIDIKDSGTAEILLDILRRFPAVRPQFTSLRHRELTILHKALPEAPILVLEHFSPFEIIHTARRLHATGISLNMWLMNPLTYRLAMRHHLELRVYTVNHPWLVRFFRRLYPEVIMYTDHPERFSPHDEPIIEQL
jgi:glycerophosphoryl diester phosphodiesterase